MTLTSRIFSSLLSKRVVVGGGAALLSASGLTLVPRDNEKKIHAAIDEFNTESLRPVPTNWNGQRFVLCNKYPKPESQAKIAAEDDGVNTPTHSGPNLQLPGEQDAPWLRFDFKKDPEMYCQIIKEYCWEGNRENSFRIVDNKVRSSGIDIIKMEWFHAPWMHYGVNGREPLNGLTFERSIPTKEFSKTQDRPLQNWAVGFYNLAGASVFGRVWSDPAAPSWDKDVKFPEGSCTFKILLTDATDDEVPTMRGSPFLDAVIAKSVKEPGDRNNFASQVRLIQADFAVRELSPIGWVFGTFMYDGNMRKSDPWDRVVPVGLQWGDDSSWNQAKHEANKADGIGPGECWINPVANNLRKNLHGTRPFWGWNGRLNGPADNYIASCASCHSTAQTGIDLANNTKKVMNGMTQPGSNLIRDPATNKMVPKDDSLTMHW
ncbi:hypothetical protein GGI35DRAFT_491568 [Trichoderma velutinum]